MAKLKLKANPTFEKEVGVPVAGGPDVPVKMTFKHRTKTELDEFNNTRTDKTDVESFLEMVVAWELEDELNVANVTEFLENYHGAAVATYRVYTGELKAAKVKN